MPLPPGDHDDATARDPNRAQSEAAESQTVERAFECRTDAIGKARSFTDEVLERDSPAVRERARLVVSELTTNAVRHARTSFVVTVERCPSRVRIEVGDRGGGWPVKQLPAAHQASGRGLLIVDTVADGWGVVERAGGKAVWFSIDLAAPAQLR